MSHFADNDGVQIHYLFFQPAAPATSQHDPHLAPPIIFVPGMSDVATDYVEILPTLGRRAAVIDLRGHGHSHSPAAGYSLADHASDIAAVVNNITNGPVHLMTFSRGTCYGLGWALANPDRVLSVSIGDYPAREIALPPEFIESFMQGRWRGTPVADRLSHVGGRLTVADAVSRDFWDELAALDVPLLVVRSTADVPLTDADWARYCADFGEATLVHFDDSPHDIFRPDRQRYPGLVRAHVEASERV